MQQFPIIVYTWIPPDKRWIFVAGFLLLCSIVSFIVLKIVHSFDRD